MISVTDDFKNTVKGDVKQYVAYLTDGEDEITHADDLKGLKIMANGGLCRTVMRQAEASFWGTHDYLDKYVNLGIGVLLPEVNDLGEVTLSIDDPCEVGLVAHGLKTGDRVQLVTTGDLPTGLAEGTFYYVVNILDEGDVIEPNIFNLASSYANAINGTLIVTTGSQSGTHNLMLHTGNFSSTDETIDYGAFKVVEVEENKANDQRVLKMYDRMYESLQEYQPVDLEFPITVKELLEDICTTLGWTLATTSFVHDDLEMERDLFMGIGLTYRDVLEDIAEVTGTIMLFSNDELVLKSVDTTSPLETLTTSDVFTLTLEPEWGELNSVVFSRTPQEDNIIEKDDESIAIYGTNELKIENNLIVDGDREAYITDTFNALKGIKYFPFEAKTTGLGYLEVGDVIKVTDKTPTEHTVLITDVEFNLTGGLNEVIKGQSPDKTTTNYEVAGIIGKRIKNTEIIVNKQEGEILSLVDDTTQIRQTAEAISLTAQTALNNSETNAENIEGLQSDVTTLEARADGLDIAVTQTGGSNLLKNSSGLKGSLEEWVQTTTDINIVSTDSFDTLSEDWEQHKTENEGYGQEPTVTIDGSVSIDLDLLEGNFSSHWLQKIISLDNSAVSLKVNNMAITSGMGILSQQIYITDAVQESVWIVIDVINQNGTFTLNMYAKVLGQVLHDEQEAINISTYPYIRIRVDTGSVFFEISEDGIVWEVEGQFSITDNINLENGWVGLYTDGQGYGDDIVANIEYDDFSVWRYLATEMATVISDTDIAMNTESGSAIEVEGNYIEQTVDTIPNQLYTFFCRFKKFGDVTVDLTGAGLEEPLDLTVDDYVDEEWAVFKYQFTTLGEQVTLKIDATAEDSWAIVGDMVLKIGDVTGWVQAPNEVYGKNFRFDKEGFSVTSQTDPFKSVLDNTKLAVYDTSSGGQRVVMVVSKDSGKISSLVAQETLSVQRYENPASRVRFIPTSTGCMIVVND